FGAGIPLRLDQRHLPLDLVLLRHRALGSTPGCRGARPPSPCADGPGHGLRPEGEIHGEPPGFQSPKGIVSSVSFVSTTNTASSLAGSVSLALALTAWRSPGSSEKLCPAL